MGMKRERVPQARGGPGRPCIRKAGEVVGSYRAERGGQRQQATKGGAPRGVGGKLGHVADAPWEGVTGAERLSKQGCKPLGGLPARIVVVEG